VAAGTLKMYHLKQEITEGSFKKILRGKVVLFGIGSILRGDDALGPALTEQLMGRVNAVCINAEGSPENFVGKIIKENPDTLLIVDAVHMDLNPGEYRVLSPEELEDTVFSTHDIPLTILADYLRSEKKMDIYILGVEPRHLALGCDLSPEIKKTVEHLKEMIIRSLAPDK
jgi:hydrogenase 3 maturation protease